MRRWAIAAVLFLSVAAVLGYLITRSPSQGAAVTATTIPTSSPPRALLGKPDSKEPKRSNARKSLPMVPYDAQPLKDAFAELSAQAKAGAVDAATRLYRDLSNCRSMTGVESTVSTLSDEILRKSTDVMDPSELESYQSELDSVETNKDYLQRLHHLCDGVTDSMYDARLGAMQKAAELGDSYARACVLQQGPGIDMRGLAAQPQLLEQYRASIPSLVQSGIAAGDWRVVEIMNGAYAPDSNSLLGGTLGVDPVQRYRFLKLYGLGYHLQYTQYSSEQLGAKLAAAAASLTADQVAAADTWAQDTFQNEFQGNDVSESTMTWGDACAF